LVSSYSFHTSHVDYAFDNGYHIFFYRSKREFTLNPTKPINDRPIELEGYTLLGGAAKPPYAISLAPIDSPIAINGPLT
jgi:hypothetical protein